MGGDLGINPRYVRGSPGEHVEVVFQECDDVTLKRILQIGNNLQEFLPLPQWHLEHLLYWLFPPSVQLLPSSQEVDAGSL